MGLVLGLSRPDEGSIEVLGLDPVHAGPGVRALVGYSPEHHNLPADMRAVDFVAHLAEVHGLPHRHAVARGSDALWQVGLGEERFRAARHHVDRAEAAGQARRRRSPTTRTCCCSTSRPTGSIRCSATTCSTLIRRIGTEYGIDVVLSSHLLDEVERVCDAAVILGEGRVLASGPLDSLRARVGGWHVEVEGSTEALEAALQGRRRRGAAPRASASASRAIATATPIRDAVARARRSVCVRLQRGACSLEDVFLEAGVYGSPNGDAS